MDRVCQGSLDTISASAISVLSAEEQNPNVNYHELFQKGKKLFKQM